MSDWLGVVAEERIERQFREDPRGGRHPRMYRECTGRQLAFEGAELTH
jgi:hypothetical protein